MAVKIRLARIGKKNAPQCRIVAIDGRSKRDGKFIEDLGTYNPLNDTFVQYRPERVEHWLNVGAIMTDSARRLHKQFQKQSA